MCAVRGGSRRASRRQQARVISQGRADANVTMVYQTRLAGSYVTGTYFMAHTLLVIFICFSLNQCISEKQIRFVKLK